jgi:hypothetical protein
MDMCAIFETTNDESSPGNARMHARRRMYEVSLVVRRAFGLSDRLDIWNCHGTPGTSPSSLSPQFVPKHIHKCSAKALAMNAEVFFHQRQDLQSGLDTKKGCLEFPRRNLNRFSRARSPQTRAQNSLAVLIPKTTDGRLLS